MIVSVLLSCAIIVLLCYYVVHFVRFRRLINLIPGPSAAPIFGQSLNLCHRPREELMKLMLSRYKKHAPIYKVWFCTFAYISISHPDDVQTILNSSKYNEKGIGYKLFHPWLNDGLLVSKGAKWQERRKILTPTFHFNILKRFFEIILEENNDMTKSLRNMEGSIVEDLASFVSHYTLNIISESAMGISLRNIDASEQQQYRKAVHDMGEVIIYRLIRPWYYSDIIFSFTSKYKQQVKCLKILHGFTDKIIAERKQYHESTNGRYLNFENKADENDDLLGSRKKRLAMLDVLIAASNNNQICDFDIREEVDTFMFAGYDTISTAVFFNILLLAEHKDVQARVRNEVNEVMKKNGGKLTIAAMQNLSYLERCLKESMRLYPSVYMMSRAIKEDVKLQSYTIPAGAELHIDVFNIHRNPEFWPNPEVFDPDRFLPELIQNRHPFSYIPFSAGSRNCIGQRFAMMELKAIIGTLVHNFYIEPIDHLKDVQCLLLADIIIRVRRPLRVKFIPIK